MGGMDHMDRMGGAREKPRLGGPCVFFVFGASISSMRSMLSIRSIAFRPLFHRSDA